MLLSSTGSSPSPFGFAGKFGYQEDTDSGLKLLGHRYYDPSTGRFLTRDPAQDGRNWYAYCDSNPLCAADSDGLQPIRNAEQIAKAALRGVGKGPDDCGHWAAKQIGMPYPGSANTWPVYLKKRPKQWKQVPNDGNTQPGDVIVTKRKGGPGHVELVGPVPKPGYLDRISASAGDNAHPGRAHVVKAGAPLGDLDRGSHGKVTVWRRVAS